VARAERPPAHVLARRVVLKRTESAAAVDRAGCSPLLALRPPAECRRPVDAGARLRVGVGVDAACHPRSASPWAGMPEMSAWHTGFSPVKRRSAGPVVS